MDYEVKYKEALERARQFSEHPLQEDSATIVEYIFPELAESKDERIRIGLIKTISSLLDNTTLYHTDITKEEALAWLEKQGKQPTDKVDTKFNVGDWISGYYTNYKVMAINSKGYVVEDTDGNKINILFENEKFHHLFTITDAKDGDVLVATSLGRGCPFIYRKTDYNNNLAYYYAGIDGNGDFCEGCIKRTLYHFGPLSNVVPATKEQRDLLFQKMKEAEYEWDAEKKELKKIEPKKLDADKVIAWLEHCNLSDCDIRISIVPDSSPTSIPHRVRWLSDDFINKFKKDFGL